MKTQHHDEGKVDSALKQASPIIALLSLAFSALFALGFWLFFSARAGAALEVRVEMAEKQIAILESRFTDAAEQQAAMLRNQEAIKGNQLLILDKLTRIDDDHGPDK